MATIDESIFKSYDIRGIYPDQINEENLYQIVQAIYAFFVETIGKDSLTIVTGHDMRLSAPQLYPILQQALVDSGATVIDIGLASTPTGYFAASHYGYDAGIQLSASHNPPEYTGMKFVINKGGKLIKIGKSTGMDEVKALSLAGKKIILNQKGSIEKKENTLQEELANANSIVQTGTIRPFTVVADAANAMGATYLEVLFEQLSQCRLIKMNFELDGSFPSHQPDPLVKKNLEPLQVRVKAEQADFGIAPDGDGDRVFFVDEQGEVVPASVITAIIAMELLREHPGDTILYDIRYTMTPKAIIAQYGGTSDITKVGHAFITQKMNETGAVFGGESSGHYFFRATGNAESQIPVILIVMDVLSKENIPFSQLVAKFSRSYESGEYNFQTENAAKILEAIQKKYTDGKLVTIDGISIEYEVWRFGVRTSNTEPLLRLNLEATTKELMEQKRDELIAFITSFGAKAHV